MSLRWTEEEALGHGLIKGRDGNWYYPSEIQSASVLLPPANRARGDRSPEFYNQMRGSKWSENEITILREFYSQEKFCLKDLVIWFEGRRSYNAIVCKAEEIGLTNLRRPASDLAKKNISIAQKSRVEREGEDGLKRRSRRTKEHQAEHGHPRGMLGKHHTVEAKQRMSEATKIKMKGLSKTGILRERGLRAMKTKLARYGKLNFSERAVSWKQGWRIVGQRRIFFRSAWEANYGRYLEFLKSSGSIKDWEHEPKTFWFDRVKRGVMSYLPDFRITNNDNSNYWVEVKGWMDARSKTKIKRFRKYYPDEKLEIVDAAWFKVSVPQLRGLIKDWE